VPGFADLLLHADPLSRLARHQSVLFVDTGAGFNATECCQAPCDHGERFELSFDLSAFPAVRALRWDPVEMVHCRVWLESISWQDRAGREHALDPGRAESNGRREADNGLSFQTIDPMVFLPVAGDVSRVTL